MKKNVAEGHILKNTLQAIKNWKKPTEKNTKPKQGCMLKVSRFQKMYMLKVSRCQKVCMFKVSMCFYDAIYFLICNDIRHCALAQKMCMLKVSRCIGVSVVSYITY